ncbi:MAG: thiolase C-terminal domain-containing protein [Sulfolobales archaeon]
MKSYIVASAAVKIDRYYEKGYKELFRDAVEELYKYVDELDIDTIIVSSMASELIDHQSNPAVILSDYMSIRDVRIYRVESGEASGAAAVQLADSLIKAGVSKKLMVVGIDKLSDLPVSHVAYAYMALKDSDYIQIQGISPLAESAILAKLYMREYDYSYEDLFIWPYTMHQNSPDTPHAQLRFKISPDSYKDSPILAEPLRLLDSYPFGDGVSILYIVSQEYLREYDSAVSIEGTGSSNDTADLASREDLLYFKAVRRSFEQALAMAKIEKNSIKYMEIHDNYTPNAFLVIESLGLVERGEAPEKFENSMINSIHINLSGGLKARGHPWGATGVYQIYEIFSALMGSFKKSVLGEIEYGLAQNMSGVGEVSYCTILRRVK